MTYLFRNFFPLFFLSLITLSCNTNSKNNESTCNQKDIKISDETSKTDDKSNSYYLFPAPGEMLQIIKNADLEYNEDLLNPSKNVENYIDSKSQTIHLGGYIADLAYLSLFGMHEQSIEYLNAIQKLSMQSHIDVDALSQNKITSLLTSENLKDSLLIVSNNMFFDMIAYLESNKREDAVSLFSVGAFIESIYISTFLIEKYSPENDLIVYISQQKGALNNLLTYAEENKKIDQTKYFALEEIKQLIMIFEKCKLVKNVNNKMVIQEKDIEMFKTAIKTLRNRLINS